MKKVFYLMLVLLLAGQVNVSAQVTIGANDDPHEGAVLDLRSTSLGLLLPQVSLDDVTVFQLDGDETTGAGMVVYNTNPDIAGGKGIGTYVWDGEKWMLIGETTVAPSLVQITGITISELSIVLP